MFGYQKWSSPFADEFRNPRLEHKPRLFGRGDIPVPLYALIHIAIHETQQVGTLERALLEGTIPGTPEAILKGLPDIQVTCAIDPEPPFAVGHD